MKRTYTLATDGACHPNPGQGAYAFVWFHGHEDDPKDYFEFVSDPIQGTTNNRVEIEAVLNGIKSLLAERLREIDKITVKCDNQYVINGFTIWTSGWAKNDFMRKVKGNVEPVKNADLWREVVSLKAELKSRAIGIKFQWVRGHAGDQFNERCDEMATGAIGGFQYGRTS